MIISIDTEKINTIASLAQNINLEIDETVSALLPVVEHNDWNCVERDAINESILEVKKNVCCLQEYIESLASAMKQVASLFDAFEASVPSKYQYIDSLLGSVFSVPCYLQSTNVVPGGVTADITDAMAKGVRVNGGLENNALGNLTNPLQVCNFADVDFSKSE